MERGELRTLYVDRREPGPVRGRRRARDAAAGGARPHRRAGHLPHHDRGAGRRRAARPRRAGARPRARSPTASGACSACARRSIRRARPATTSGSSATWPHGWATLGLRRAPRTSGTRCARCRRCTRGMTYARLEELGGIQWPCSGRAGPEPRSCTAACGRRPGGAGAGRRSTSSIHEPPVDELSDEFPMRLTTGRRLDSYNTGVQTGGYSSPLRRGESLDLSPEDCAIAGRGRGRAASRSAPAAAR